MRVQVVAGLEQGIQLVRKHEQLIVEPHSHVMRFEAGPGRERAGCHRIHDQSRPAPKRELAAEHRRGAGERHSQPKSIGRWLDHLRHRQQVRPRCGRRLHGSGRGCHAPGQHGRQEPQAVAEAGKLRGSHGCVGRDVAGMWMPGQVSDGMPRRRHLPPEWVYDVFATSVPEASQVFS